MNMNSVKAGDVVKFKTLIEARHNSESGNGGWSPKMAGIVEYFRAKEIILSGVSGCSKKWVYFAGSGGWSWHSGCFEFVRTKEAQEARGYNKFKAGDKVERSRRFTAAYQAGETHIVDRVSACGLFLWVCGNRHKTPMRYFKLHVPVHAGDVVKSRLTGTEYTVHDVSACKTKFRKVSNLAQGFIGLVDYELVSTKAAPFADIPAGGLSTFDTPVLEAPSLDEITKAPPSDQGQDCGSVGAPPTPPRNPALGIAPKADVYSSEHYRKFESGNIVRSRNGSRELEVKLVSGCGYKFQAAGARALGWLFNADFDKVEEHDLINRDIVAGLVLQGVSIQHRNFGEWLDVNPDVLTVSMIKRLDFRLKPLDVDFHGTKLPAPLNVDITTLRTVYGVSFNNRKVFPCAISTARSNKSKGYGQYWQTEADAKLVLDALLKPFTELSV